MVDTHNIDKNKYDETINHMKNERKQYKGIFVNKKLIGVRSKNNDSLVGSDIVDELNDIYTELDMMKLRIHLLERIVYMLDTEIELAIEEGFNVSDWYMDNLVRAELVRC